MRYLLLSSLCVGMLLFYACKKEKECTEPQYCFTGPSQIRITYLDSEGQNMLAPNHPERIVIQSVKSKDRASIRFEVTNKIGGTIETNWWHLALTRTPISVRPNCNDHGEPLGCTLCINEACELYIAYDNRSEIDTLNILQESVTEYDENNCPCTYYELRLLNHNGKSIIPTDGIIRK